MKKNLYRIAIATLALALAFPTLTFAATQVTVEETVYTERASGTGSGGGTWSWDGEDGFELSDFVGGCIEAIGNLDVTLKGDNEARAIITTATENEAGDLSITGEDGSTLTATEMEWWQEGIRSDGSLTIENADITLENSQISVDENLAVKDSTITGHMDADTAIIVLNSKNDSNASFSNSTVHVKRTEVGGGDSEKATENVEMNAMYVQASQELYDFIGKYYQANNLGNEVNWDALQTDYPDIYEEIYGSDDPREVINLLLNTDEAQAMKPSVSFEKEEGDLDFKITWHRKRGRLNIGWTLMGFDDTITTFDLVPSEENEPIEEDEPIKEEEPTKEEEQTTEEEEPAKEDEQPIENETVEETNDAQPVAGDSAKPAASTKTSVPQTSDPFACVSLSMPLMLSGVASLVAGMYGRNRYRKQPRMAEIEI